MDVGSKDIAAGRFTKSRKWIAAGRFPKSWKWIPVEQRWIDTTAKFLPLLPMVMRVEARSHEICGRAVGLSQHVVASFFASPHALLTFPDSLDPRSNDEVAQRPTISLPSVDERPRPTYDRVVPD